MGIRLDAGKLAEIAKKVVAAVKDKAAKEPGGLKGLDGVRKCVPWVVKAVEKAAVEAGLLGPQKQEVAVQAVLALVPDRWIPDWILDPIVRWIIDKAVEVIKADAKK